MKTIQVSDDVYRRIKNLADDKGLSMKKTVEYAVRVTISIDEAAGQLQGDKNNLFTCLRDIPSESRREIAFQIRNQSRLIRGLSIMVEMLSEDLHELRFKDHP